MPVRMLPPTPMDDGRMHEIDATIRGDRRRKPVRHGTRYEYVAYHCRCRQCRLAHGRYMREWESKNRKHRKRYQRERYLRKLWGATRGPKGL